MGTESLGIKTEAEAGNKSGGGRTVLEGLVVMEKFSSQGHRWDAEQVQ